jgi:pimeloyl-ACP methyl ester carboxylesterase
MLLKYRKRFLCLFIIAVLFGPSTGSAVSPEFADLPRLTLAELPLGEEVKSSGQKLIAQPFGFTHIGEGQAFSDSVLVVIIHGYGSRGYEWVYPIHRLVQRFGAVYFFRYDWEACPAEAAETFVSTLQTIYSRYPATTPIVLFSHSYGGLVALAAVGKLQEFPLREVHIIAAPLRGYPGLLDDCSWSVEDYLYRRPGVLVVQWRTRHRQDHAFYQLPDDPQVVELPESLVIRLPATMDGHRLGHNWSITWVVDHYPAALDSVRSSFPRD